MEDVAILDINCTLGKNDRAYLQSLPFVDSLVFSVCIE